MTSQCNYEKNPIIWYTGEDNYAKRVRIDVSARPVYQETRSTPSARSTHFKTPGLPLRSTHLKIKTPSSPVSSCPGVNCVTSEKNLTPGQRKYPKFNVKKRKRETEVEEKRIRTGQHHSTGQCSEIKVLLTGWPHIDLHPEPIRSEDFDFRRCLYECLNHKELHRWPVHRDKIVYGPVLNGSDYV